MHIRMYAHFPNSVEEILSVVSDSRAAALVLGEHTRGLVVAPSYAPSAAPVGCWSSQRSSGSCSSLNSSELKCIWGAVMEMAY